MELFFPLMPLIIFFDLFKPIYTYFDLFGPIWTFLDLIWSFLTYSGIFCPSCTFLNLFGLIWTPRKAFQPMQDHACFYFLLLALAFSVAVGRHSGSQLATTLVDTISNISFFSPPPPLSSVIYFSHRWSAHIKNFLWTPKLLGHIKLFATITPHRNIQVKPLGYTLATP